MEAGKVILDIKGKVHPKIKIMSSFTHPYFVLNLNYDSFLHTWIINAPKYYKTGVLLLLWYLFVILEPVLLASSKTIKNMYIHWNKINVNWNKTKQKTKT